PTRAPRTPSRGRSCRNARAAARRGRSLHQPAAELLERLDEHVVFPADFDARGEHALDQRSIGAAERARADHLDVQLLARVGGELDEQAEDLLRLQRWARAALLGLGSRPTL